MDLLPHQRISIHAPLRGATTFDKLPVFQAVISIHAPLRGATLSTFYPPAAVCYFNPRSPAGSDKGKRAGCIFRMISIHAPLRGATPDAIAFVTVSIFQSTLPCGERLGLSATLSNLFEFQSTLPCGERHLPNNNPQRRRDFNPRSPAGSDNMSFSFRSIWPNFNPRSPAGSDPQVFAMIQENRISIHAPLRGATCNYLLLKIQNTISIHAPLRGATMQIIDALRALHQFQSTLPCGERPLLMTRRPTMDKFQSTLPCGERPPKTACRLIIRTISIHAPLRGATVEQWIASIPDSNFNPRSPAGSDMPPYITCYMWRHFNPRSPAGSDLGSNLKANQRQTISIHAPLRGATTVPSAVQGWRDISIHAPLRGATANMHKYIIAIILLYAKTL